MPHAVSDVVFLVISATMPGLGGIVGAASLERAARVRAETLVLCWLLAAAAGATVIVWLPDFIRLWVGSRYDAGPTATVLICVMVLQFVLIRVDSNVIDVTLQVRAKVLLGLMSAALVVGLGVLLVGVAELGIPGIVAAMILGRAPLSIAYPVLIARLLRMRTRAAPRSGLAARRGLRGHVRGRAGAARPHRPTLVGTAGGPRVADRRAGRRGRLRRRAGRRPAPAAARQGCARGGAMMPVPLARAVPEPDQKAARGGAMMRFTYRLLVLLVASVPLENVYSVPGSGSVTKLLGLATGVAWGIAVLARGGLRAPHTLHLVALLFVVWNASSLLWTIDTDATQTRVQDLRAALRAAPGRVGHRPHRQRRCGRSCVAYLLGCYAAAVMMIGGYVVHGASEEAGTRDAGRLQPQRRRHHLGARAARRLLPAGDLAGTLPPRRSRSSPAPTCRWASSRS